MVVAGAVNVDIGGQSAGPLVGRDSNPGKVTVSMGGVGRNIAHNLRLLGVKVSLLTALGEDPHAGQVMDSCERLGIDLSRALHVPGGTTSTYLFLSDETGDMALAVSDMGIYEELTPAYFARAPGVPQRGVPGGGRRQSARRRPGLPGRPLHRAAAGGPGVHGEGGEGEAHSGEAPHPQAQPHGGGIPLRGEDHRPGQRRRAAEKLLETGLERVFISLGEEGVFAADHQRDVWFPCCPAQMHSATGAGDAFAAALGWAFLEGKDLADSARAANAAAAIAVEGEKTINPALSADAVQQRMQEQEERI